MTEPADVPAEPVPSAAPAPAQPTAPAQPADPAAAAVQEVLASLEDLEQRPVGEHAAAFEQAHDRLRALIDHAGDAPREPGPPETDAAPPPA